MMPNSLTMLLNPRRRGTLAVDQVVSLFGSDWRVTTIYVQSAEHMRVHLDRIGETP